MSDFDPHHISPLSANPGFVSPLSASAQGGTATPTLSDHSAGKRRKLAKSKISPILKRSASTPQMSGFGEDEDTSRLSPSALDKRRNKLGYQRISIACGHCRRRKIRCVVAENDEIGRCQNCIRLKKECVFYPVDSTGGAESRAQQKIGAGSKASSVMSNSPSDYKMSGMVDGEREFNRFPPLASNAPPEIKPSSSGSGLGISSGTALNTPEYGYDSGLGSRDGWHSGMFHHADSANSDTSTTGSWRVQDSPRVSDFSTFPTSEGQSGGVYPGYNYAPPRAEYGMPPPMRSISYGHVEPSIGQFQAPSSANPIDFNRQGQSVHYALPSTDITHAPATASMLGPAVSPVVTESMQFYSPQWQYYQQSPHAVGMDFPRHDSVNLHWYGPQIGQGVDGQTRQQQQQQQQPHQQQQQQHQQHWQGHHDNAMPPPGSEYGRDHGLG